MGSGAWRGALGRSGLVVLGLALAACRSSEPARRAAPAAAAAGAGLAPVQGALGPGERLATEDTNGDGRPDVRVTTRKVRGPAGEDVERVLRRELDIDSDGTFDVTKDFDVSRPLEEGEVLVRERVDSDLDGKPDTATVYEKGLVVRQERDLDGDGRPDVWLHYVAGRQSLSERDTNGDGRVDLWEYWKDGRVERTAEDTDGDGKPDKVTGNPNAPSPASAG